MDYAVRRPLTGDGREPEKSFIPRIHKRPRQWSWHKGVIGGPEGCSHCISDSRIESCLPENSLKTEPVALPKRKPQRAAIEVR